MATKETSVMDELRDLTECSICNSMISDPRGLPCIHTFCLKCLENFESSSQKKPGDKMSCPVCRKEFTIPPEGMNGLQKNFFIERLTELMKISEPIGIVTGCDACKINNDSTETEAEVTEYCIQCREKLCSRCSMEHVRNRLSRNHQVVEIGCDVTEILTEKHYSSACDLHPEEKIKMYCVECKVVICMMCFAESHNTHKCMDVRKAGEKFQREIENDIKNLIDFAKETLDTKELHDEVKKVFLKELQDTERAIKCNCKELKDLADKNVKDLLDELNSVEQKRFKVMDSRKEEVERHLDSIERFNTYSKEIISRGSPSDICRAVNDLHVRAAELQKLHKIHIRQKETSVYVSLQEVDLQGLICVDNVIGCVKAEERYVKISKESTGVKVIAETKANANAIRRQAESISTWFLMTLVTNVVFMILSTQPKNVSEFPVERLNISCDSVLSISFSQTAINILCSNPQRIFIYEDRSPFNLKNSLSLDWMIEPETMVASPSSDSLYVADLGTDCIWVISRNGAEYVKTKWLCDDDLRIQSLSGDGGTILATNEYFWKLKLYNTEYARLFHSFELAMNTYNAEFCHRAQSVVKMSTGDFIVSCGSRRDYTKFICKFNKTGSIVQCYTPRKASEELNPIHMSLTSDDQVIVADTQNKRILLLNSDLGWSGVLLTGDYGGGIIKPMLLSYKSDKKLLAVVNFDKGVDVYNFNAFPLRGKL